MSIIESAVAIKNDPSYKVLPNNSTWECLAFNVNGVDYDVAFQPDYYGNHARQFMVNGSWISPVQSKYWEKGMKTYPKFLTYSQDNSLCGVRTFDEGSINYEFLYKPIGLQITKESRTGYRSESYQLKKHLDTLQIPYQEWVFSKHIFIHKS